LPPGLALGAGAVGDTSGSEGAGVVVFFVCGDFFPSLAALHLFLFAFHWHAVSPEQEASSLYERQGSDGLQALSKNDNPAIVKTHFIKVTP
jgi:hypothetical protein